MSTYSLITARALVALEKMLTHKSRKTLLTVAEAFFVCALLFLAYAHYFVSVPRLAVQTVGVILLVIVCWAVVKLFDVYARSYDSDHEPYWIRAYAIAVRSAEKKDCLHAYAETQAGYEVLLRLGMSPTAVTELMRAHGLKPSTCTLSSDAWVSFTLLSQELFRGEADLREALFAVSVGEKEFMGAVRMVMEEEDIRRQRERWWTAESLGRIKSIGKDWAYGDTFRLDRYSEDLTRMRLSAADAEKSAMHAAEITSIEAALSRADEANVFLVGHPGAGVQDIIYGLAEKIISGKTTPALAHKRTVLFRGVGLVSGSKEKSVFEHEFILTMNEVVHAGNVLLVFDDFAAFYTSAQALGSDVAALLTPYLASSAIQIIALSDATHFHSIFEGNQGLMSKFEKIIIDEPGHDATVSLIAHMSSDIEARSGLTFTYPALISVVECAEQYITEGVMPDKAVDLLMDLSSTLVRDHDFFVTKDDVLQFVKLKTKIPVGAIDSSEKEKLEHLEEFLHQRVVGQSEAVSAVANALRRVRSGIRNPNRPIGTFLFLGPTGVGKTETAKALASAYFANEQAMMRLDMNQYKESDAIDRLIGSFGAGKPGILSSMIRDKKYGVLLLDEFEKASSNVKDLFLQILDEGVFADATGEKVNARNIIFIATSNAGSDDIFRIVNEGGKLSEHKDELTNKLVGDGTLKPELINRFDGVILFEPLSKENIAKIAEIILGKLQKRLREKGIDFVINPATVEAVVKIGYDPKFGARPMNRAIQDKVEGLIARKIIAGELPAGSKIELTATDLA